MRAGASMWANGSPANCPRPRPRPLPLREAPRWGARVSGLAGLGTSVSRAAPDTDAISSRSMFDAVPVARGR